MTNIVTPLPVFGPINPVTPFTYRDNDTFQTQLRGLRDKVNEQIAQLELIDASLRSDMGAEILDLTNQLNMQLTTINDILMSATDYGLDIRVSAIEDAVFNIRLFGATTESLDNRAAIQAALDTAAVAGGVVWIPVGVWNVKAITGRTFTIAANVSVIGEDRARSVIRVHESSGDWAYLFVYSTTHSCDNVSFKNLTVDGGTPTNPTTTAVDWLSARTLFNLIGTNIVIQECDLISNGVWVAKLVGDNVRVVDNNITVDNSAYTLGWFDQSAIWLFSQNGRVTGNTFITHEPTVSPFVVQTAIEFQGHRNIVSDNISSAGSRFRNFSVFTASTYFTALANFYPASPKGAIDNVIESNLFTVTRYGVEVWGMVVSSPDPIRGLRVRRNTFVIDNSSGDILPCALLNVYVGTTGGSGNSGPQTSSIRDLKVSDNTIRFAVRRVSTSFYTADCGVRLSTETIIVGAVISGNRFVNCGGFGVFATVVDTSEVWVDGLDIENNVFTDVREPVRIGRNLKNWHVENNEFEQNSSYSTFIDNMLETVASRANDYTTELGGIVRNNTIRCLTGHKPFYPRRDQNVAQSAYPISRGYVVEQMGAQIQVPNIPVTVGSGDIVRQLSDGVFVKAQFTSGATLGTLTGVTITGVIDSSTMTVSNGSYIQPGQVLTLPFQTPFASGSAVVIAVVGNTVMVGGEQLDVYAGHTWAEAIGAALTYYGAVVAV